MSKLLSSLALVMGLCAYLWLTLFKADDHAKTVHTIATAASITYIQSDKHGYVNSILHAQHATYRQNDQTTQLQHPRLTLYQKPQHPPWHVSADRGRAAPRAHTPAAPNHLTDSIITLWGHVHLYQKADAHHSASNLHTTTLTIYPHQKRAITHAPVTIAQAGLTVHAKGLVANLETGEIQLLDHIAGTYTHEHTEYH